MRGLVVNMFRSSWSQEAMSDTDDGWIAVLADAEGFCATGLTERTTLLNSRDGTVWSCVNIEDDQLGEVIAAASAVYQRVVHVGISDLNGRPSLCVLSISGGSEGFIRFAYRQLSSPRSDELFCGEWMGLAEPIPGPLVSIASIIHPALSRWISLRRRIFSFSFVAEERPCAVTRLAWDKAPEAGSPVGYVIQLVRKMHEELTLGLDLFGRILVFVDRGDGEARRLERWEIEGGSFNSMDEITRVARTVSAKGQKPRSIAVVFAGILRGNDNVRMTCSIILEMGDQHIRGLIPLGRDGRILDGGRNKFAALSRSAIVPEGKSLLAPLGDDSPVFDQVIELASAEQAPIC